MRISKRTKSRQKSTPKRAFLCNLYRCRKFGSIFVQIAQKSPLSSAFPSKFAELFPKRNIANFAYSPAKQTKNDRLPSAFLSEIAPSYGDFLPGKTLFAADGSKLYLR
ncbi:MAG: hypothetical protein LUH43_06950 [Clostridia bacterium]|nr:hypothetical protein [Clostridia bacterium]